MTDIADRMAEHLYRAHGVCLKTDVLRDAIAASGGADAERYRKAFEHIHVRGHQGDIDRCEKCGLDLRDQIHRRA